MRGSGAAFRGEDDDRDLGAVLDDLKSAGCAVLVTGTAPEACVAASQKLFGAPHQHRRRVLVTHETGSDADRWLPEGVSVCDETELLRPPLIGRDTASDSPAPDDTALDGPTIDDPETDVSGVETPAHGGPTTEPPDGGPTAEPSTTALDRLRSDLSDVISDYQSDRLEPGEVRVGVTSADALASKYGRTELLSFVRTATALIRGVRGLGHLQLGQSRDGDLVPLLDDLFDARVDVRKQPGLPAEQRWHVPGYGTTEWIRIEE
ncbi:DUF7504 family protein [Salinirubrum litoreum]|uniref:Uncharacterized protein n=1 Tax=Salinirubrum litoreum TaxID=1126234 RepID=A0ABD5RCC1_9EURY|nr:hypothetical protein [Salinirubrum litoreum]